jgi:hypothetical protein
MKTAQDEPTQDELDGPAVVRALRETIRQLRKYPGRKDRAAAHQEIADCMTKVVETGNWSQDLNGCVNAVEKLRAEWQAAGPAEAVERYWYKDMANKLKGVLTVVESTVG